MAKKKELAADTHDEIAAILRAHQLDVVQAVKPFRTIWRCRTCGDHEVDVSIRLDIAQADHQASVLAAAGIV